MSTVHNPHDRLRVELTEDQRTRLDRVLEVETGVAVAVFGRSVAGSLQARQYEGEMRRLRQLWGAVATGEDVFTADQLRTMLQLTAHPEFTDIRAALVLAWEGEALV